MLNRYQLLVSVIGAGIYFFFLEIKNPTIDSVVQVVASLQMGLGIYLVLKFIQYFFFSEKTMAQVIHYKKSATSTGKIQDIGSYLVTIRYSFLIDDDVYTMPENYYVAEKYKIGEMIKAAISSRDDKIAVPMQSVYRLLFFGAVSLAMAIGMGLK